MKRLLTSLLLAITLVACGDDGGTTKDIDAPSGPPIDANVDAPPAPMMIMLSGTATARSAQGSMPVADALIEAFTNANETTPIAMATTNAMGQFTMTVTTTGTALQGYLKATKAGFLVTYLYPAAPIAADTSMIPINMLTQGNFDLVETLTGQTQDPANGFIALVVVDGPMTTSMPVGGATVTSNPASGAYKYNGTNGLPNNQATSTHTDGVAYMFNVPPDQQVVVSADKAGLTFVPHGVKARPGALTTTLITP